PSDLYTLSLHDALPISLPVGAQEIRATDKTAVPGFIDVHIHGAGGHDVMEGTNAALRCITRKVSEYGTTSLVATTVTASTDQTLDRKSTRLNSSHDQIS